MCFVSVDLGKPNKQPSMDVREEVRSVSLELGGEIQIRESFESTDI